jgi:hypothetical protein
MIDELRCWCKHCGEELEPGHTGVCPKCGKTGKECKVTASVVVGVKDSVAATHKPKWSSESLALFSAFLAIFLAIVCPGILTLLPFSPSCNYGILVGFLVVAGFIFWWQRYRVLMLIRWLEGRFGGEKTSR